MAESLNGANSREDEAISSSLQSLENVEEQLNLLLQDLQSLRLPQNAIADETISDERWENALEGFRVKATTIRRILDRFHQSDLSTRRYLRFHLDEEFAQLKRAYDTLREQFTEKNPDTNSRDQGGRPWNG